MVEKVEELWRKGLVEKMSFEPGVEERGMMREVMKAKGVQAVIRVCISSSSNESFEEYSIRASVQ